MNNDMKQNKKAGATMGLIFGAGIGVLFGLIFAGSGLGVSMGLVFGAGIGLIFGGSLVGQEK